MDKVLVAKSHRMMRARDGMLTHQHRLLGLAVSKLDPYKDEFDKVEVTYAEYCRLAGERIENKHYDRFYKTARTALKRSIYIETGNGDEWIDCTLCPTVRGKSGRIWVSFNQDLKQHFIEIKERFAQIGLDTYFSLRRDYSAGFYELLKTHEFQADKNGSFFVDITVEDIRHKFQLQEKYKKYKDLKKRVVLDALNEINDRTELKFVRLEETGRPVSKIRIWAVKGKPKPEIQKLPDPEQLRLIADDELEKARQAWPDGRIREALKEKVPESVSDEMWMLKHGLEVRRIGGQYQVVGLVEKEPEGPKAPQVTASPKQTTVIFEAVREGKTPQDEADRVVVSEPGIVRQYVGWIMGKNPKPKF